MNHSLRGEVQILRERRIGEKDIGRYPSLQYEQREQGRSRLTQHQLFDHLELRGSVQPALVLVEALPVLSFPDNLVDSLQYPSATRLSTLK